MPAVVAFRLRARALHRPQFRVVVGGALGSLGLLLTVFKQGTYINMLFTVVEPPLLMSRCAVGHGSSTVLAARATRRALPPPGWRPRSGSVQVGSLLRSPSSPRLFALPLSGKPLVGKLTEVGVGRAVAAASRCPSTDAYSGTPYVAFIARRLARHLNPTNSWWALPAPTDASWWPRVASGPHLHGRRRAAALRDEYGVTKGE